MGKINDDKVWESNKKNNNKLDSHNTDSCFKANQKLSVLSRLASLLTFDKKWFLFKAFFESQFRYFEI